MKVITISGKARHGKDTVAKLLKNELTNRGNTVLICHYADLLKYICKTFFGWDGNKDLEGRTLLQYVGTDVVREKNENYWIEFIKSVLRMFPDEWDYVLIPDTRFPNEIEEMKSEFDCVSLKVIRLNYDSGLTDEQLSHPSETALDDYSFDYIVENDGTYDDLKNKISVLIERMLGYVDKQ